MIAPHDDICTIYQAVEIGVQRPDSWFRGHDEMYGNLKPRYFRDYGDPVMEEGRPDREMVFIEDFKRDASAIPGSESLPADDDILGWLYRMRHYRAPTRLLDWTENILAALFFAVSDSSKWGEEHGELWMLHPESLNVEAEVGWGLPLYGRNPVLDYLVREPYWPNHDALAEKIAAEYEDRVSGEWIDDPEPFVRPVAFKPHRDFRRMLVQSSVFTIHPRPTEGNKISDLLTDGRSLVRYRVPKERKELLWQQLRRIGITDRTLFPDFEGLSRTIAPPKERVGRGPELPEPPAWSDSECCEEPPADTGD